ncbi:MAG: hypothetical protein ACRETK_03030, partial [Steroidobacteraceae bacterium]
EQHPAAVGGGYALRGRIDMDAHTADHRAPPVNRKECALPLQLRRKNVCSTFATLLSVQSLHLPEVLNQVRPALGAEQRRGRQRQLRLHGALRRDGDL